MVYSPLSAQSGLDFDLLKGKDMAVVKVLQQACRQTGFTCFLASCEREVYGACEADPGDNEWDHDFDPYNDRWEEEEAEEEDEDEETDDEAETRGLTGNNGNKGRIAENDGDKSSDYGEYHKILDVCNESFDVKRLVDLSGQLVGEYMPIKQGWFLEAEPFKKRIPDDEDYSGFTGNEGVSATHWYRDSVVVVVPKTKIADFLLHQFVADRSIYSRWSARECAESNVGLEDIIPYFMTAANTDISESDSKQALQRLGCIVISTRKESWKHQDFISDAGIGRIAELAAELHDVKLFELAASSCKKHLPFHTFTKTSSFLQSVSFDEFVSMMTKAFKPLTLIYENHSAIQDVQAALSDEGRDSSGRNIPQKCEWLSGKLEEVLGTAPPRCAEDGSALVAILNTPRGGDIHLEQISELAKRNAYQTPFTIAYLVSLFEIAESDVLISDEIAAEFTSLLQVFISKFSLQDHEQEEQERQKSLSGYSNANSPAEENAVYAVRLRLPNLLSHIFRLGLREDAATLLDKVTASANELQPSYLKRFFLPLLRDLLPVLETHNIALNDPIIQSLYQSVFSSYMERYVGQKPLPPRTWTKLRVPCKCTICAPFNDFLVDPVQRLARFSIKKKDRDHLQYSRSEGDCKFETEQFGSPYTLIVTKMRPEYDRAVNAWTGRCGEAKSEFADYGQTRLPLLLGDRYAQIVNGFAPPVAASGNGGARKKQKTGHSHAQSHPLAQANGNAILPSSSKAGAKRKAVEIIDLTGDD